MKYAIVKASELGDRFDAGFHLARKEHEARTAELAATISAEDAIERLNQLPLRHLKALEPLRRGDSVRPIDLAGAHRIIAEYPHLSLAIVEASREAIEADIDAEIAALRAKREMLDDLTAPTQAPRLATEADRADHSAIGPQEGYAYPLTDPARYDDELGEAFDHAAVPDGESGGDFSIRDMWIVDHAGNHHPGYNQSPVPMAMSGVDLTRGTPMAKTLRDRAKFTGWQ